MAASDGELLGFLATPAWALVFAAIQTLLAIVASAHVVLYKRDVRAAIGWAGLIWLTPIVGSLLYGFFGINRIRRRAARLDRPTPSRPAIAPDEASAPGQLALQRLAGFATGLHLLGGNAVVPLQNGDEAYPAMIDAIAGARRSIFLCTYIFDHDRAGDLFLEALADARKRGVEVRVLIDGVGARYSRLRMTRALRRRGVVAAEFLPSAFPLRNPYLNLRNHRKLLLVDGRTAFTGGLNIREGCILELDPPPAFGVQDVHFRIRGPVVAQLFEAVLIDWRFTTGETLDGAAWQVDPTAAGETQARVVADGPDEDFETMRTVLLGALAAATRRVTIVTPYFLPDQILMSGLRVAAMRGIEVDIVLPTRANLRLVQWASQAQLWQPIEAGCRVWLSPPPFDHTKLMIVDSGWVLLGSANWDPRSLRLNFELGVECYDPHFAAAVSDIVAEKKAACRELTSDDVASRRLPVRLRDGIARLFSPYL